MVSQGVLSVLNFDFASKIMLATSPELKREKSRLIQNSIEHAFARRKLERATATQAAKFGLEGQASAGMKFVLPGGLRRERATERNALLRMKQREAFIKDQERLLISQLSDAIAKVEGARALMKEYRNGMIAASKEVDARFSELEKGLSPVNTVLQSQQHHADAESKYYRTVGEVKKSTNYVHYLTGTLLVSNRVAIYQK